MTSVVAATTFFGAPSERIKPLEGTVDGHVEQRTSPEDEQRSSPAGCLGAVSVTKQLHHILAVAATERARITEENLRDICER